MAWGWDKLPKRLQQNGGGPSLPDFEEVFDKLKNIKGKFPGVALLVALGAVFWLSTGIYIVAPDEIGVVKRFGKTLYTTGPGPHYHLPYPIETVLKTKVTQEGRAERGFRTYTPDSTGEIPGSADGISHADRL